MTLALAVLAGALAFVSTLLPSRTTQDLFVLGAGAIAVFVAVVSGVEGSLFFALGGGVLLASAATGESVTNSSFGTALIGAGIFMEVSGTSVTVEQNYVLSVGNVLIGFGIGYALSCWQASRTRRTATVAAIAMTMTSLLYILLLSIDEWMLELPVISATQDRAFLVAVSGASYVSQLWTVPVPNVLIALIVILAMVPLLLSLGTGPEKEEDRDRVSPAVIVLCGGVGILMLITAQVLMSFGGDGFPMPNADEIEQFRASSVAADAALHIVPATERYFIDPRARLPIAFTGLFLFGAAIIEGVGRRRSHRVRLDLSLWPVAASWTLAACLYAGSIVASSGSPWSMSSPVPGILAVVFATLCIELQVGWDRRLRNVLAGVVALSAFFIWLVWWGTLT